MRELLIESCLNIKFFFDIFHKDIVRQKLELPKEQNCKIPEQIEAFLDILVSSIPNLTTIKYSLPIRSFFSNTIVRGKSRKFRI